MHIQKLLCLIWLVRIDGRTMDGPARHIITRQNGRVLVIVSNASAATIVQRRFGAIEADHVHLACAKIVVRYDVVKWLARLEVYVLWLMIAVIVHIIRHDLIEARLAWLHIGIACVTICVDGGTI